MGVEIESGRTMPDSFSGNKGKELYEVQLNYQHNKYIATKKVVGILQNCRNIIGLSTESMETQSFSYRQSRSCNIRVPNARVNNFAL